MARVSNCVVFTYDGTSYNSTGDWSGATNMVYKGKAVTKQQDGGISFDLGLCGPTCGGGTLHNQVDPFDFSNCSFSWTSN
jgi:hypothetical protein